MDYYRGNFYRESADLRGWLLGRFMAGKGVNDARNTDKFEVKFWKFKKGEDAKHLPKYQKTATECTFILKGKIMGEIKSQPIVLEAGEYVVIPPGTVSNFPKTVIEDVEGLTIKAPSAEGDTVKLSA